MYKGQWIHSLLYFKFVELTLEIRCDKVEKEAFCICLVISDESCIFVAVSSTLITQLKRNKNENSW